MAAPAVASPGYVYEAWIGCGGEGFARSTDGGVHFQKPITLPDSSGSDDPAVAVSPDGVVYVSYLRYHGGYAQPVVTASYDHGATFSQVTSLIPHVKGNWGDRDFITAGRNGTVYVIWDYGPSAADVKLVCSPVGSSGDTFGLSVRPAWHAPFAPDRVALSWGSAIGNNPDSEIYATVVRLPHGLSA